MTTRARLLGASNDPFIAELSTWARQITPVTFVLALFLLAAPAPARADDGIAAREIESSAAGKSGVDDDAFDGGEAEDDEEEFFDDEEIDGFLDMNLDELLNMDVTSVAGVGMSLRSTPAALFVIDSDMIRRSGHKHLAELFRMVPGMQVARATSNTWAITSRGFLGRFSNKLLILVDGRTIYDPLFGGVFWEIQDLPLEDVERIEVVRGPGGTLWGANAVNGIINIVTKHSRDTQGVLAVGGGGNVEKGFGTGRYGGSVGDDFHYRLYGMYQAIENFQAQDGGDYPDDWDTIKLGARGDWDIDEMSRLRISGDFYRLDENGSELAFIAPSQPPPTYTTIMEDNVLATGGNVIVRYERDLSDDSGYSIAAFYDRIERDATLIVATRDTADVDFRHHFKIAEWNQIIWGLGYRVTTDKIEDNPVLEFDPLRESDQVFSAFLQDTITIKPELLTLMIGSKVEHNEYSGWEVQPTARISWTPTENQTVWAAVSRAVRTPTRVEQDMALTVAVVDFGFGPTPIQLSLDDPDSEKLIAYEVGYRTRPTDTTSFDVAAFVNEYHDLVTFTAARPNQADASTYGFELSASWQARENWKLTGGYTYTLLDAQDNLKGEESTTPRNVFNVRSYLTLFEDFEVNSAVYYTDNMRAIDVSSNTRVDLGLVWRAKPGIEVAVWGQNLLEKEHVEFVDTVFQLRRVTVPRSIYAQVTLRF